MHGRTIRWLLCDMNLSSTIIKRLKRTENAILLNGLPARTNQTVCCDDVLTVTICDTPSGKVVASELPLEILYQDQDIIAVNKPRSMPTHPSLNHYRDTLANALAYYFQDPGYTFRAITRLDSDTSGVVLVAKNSASAAILNHAMQNSGIKKEYLAVINGTPKQSSGRIVAPIKRKQDSLVLRCVADDGKPAITDYFVEKSFKDFCLVRLVPLTGRTHQLRVHMSYIGHPIYGDDLYSAPQKNQKNLLHCSKLSFKKPFTQQDISITADIPEDMKRIIHLN